MVFRFLHGFSMVFPMFLPQAGLRSGLTLTAVVDPIRLSATKRAFAAWRLGGGVVVWGAAGDGGHPLRRMQQLQTLVWWFGGLNDFVIYPYLSMIFGNIVIPIDVDIVQGLVV